MSVIVPAVLPKSKQELEATLARLAAVEGVSTVQIDAVDGRFANPASWPYAEGAKEFAEMIAKGEMLLYAGRLKFDIDLMVSDPESVTGSWIALGASRLTIHIESTNYLPQIISDLRRKYGRDREFAPELISFGIAIGLSSDPTLLEQYLPHVDYVQFMGIATIGRQGQAFDRRVVERVKTFRKKHPDIAVQVDGGVTRSSAPLLLAAGVSRLVVGHDLLQAGDIQKEFNDLTALTEAHGIYERV